MVHAQTRAKAAEASARREARAKREERKRPPILMVNAGTTRKGDTRSRTAER